MQKIQKRETRSPIMLRVIENHKTFPHFYELTGKTVAKEVFASAMTEGSVGLPSPDLRVCHWIRLDQSGSDWIGDIHSNRTGI